MGQYYSVVLDRTRYSVDIEKKDGSRDWNGLKLMEHSWLQNPLTLAVLKEIYENPTRVTWVGDYVYYLLESRQWHPQIQLDNERIAMLNRIANPENRDNEKYLKESNDFEEKLIGLYLVNETKEQFISLDRYRKLSTTKDGWCVSPLIITAISNGLGGGDYRGENKNLVGIWGYDKLYTTHKKPEDYSETVFSFKEEW